MPSNPYGDLPPVSNTPTPVVLAETLYRVHIGYLDGSVAMFREQAVQDGLGNTVATVTLAPLSRSFGAGYTVTVNGSPLTLEQWASLAVDFAVLWRAEDNSAPVVNP
jgi:hypothetical protein